MNKYILVSDPLICPKGSHKAELCTTSAVHINIFSESAKSMLLYKLTYLTAGNVLCNSPQSLYLHCHV
jgi:hypothetical protein